MLCFYPQTFSLKLCDDLFDSEFRFSNACDVLCQFLIISQSLDRPIEKRIAAKIDFECQDPERPDIDRLSVDIVFCDVFEDLGGQVGVRPDKGLGEVILFGDSKVSQLVAIILADGVLRLDIPVYDIQLVDVAEASRQVSENQKQFLLGKSSCLRALHEGGQRSLAKLHQQIE